MMAHIPHISRQYGPAGILAALIVAALSLTGCAELKDLRARTAKQEAEIARLRHENSVLEQAYYQINQGRDVEEGGLLQRVGLLETELERARNTRSERERELEDQLRDLSLRYEAQKTEAEARLARSNADVTSVTSALAEAERRRLETEAKLAELQAAQNESRARIETLGAEIETQRQAAEKLEAARVQGQSELEAERLERQRAAAELESLRGQLDSERKKYDEASQSIVDLKQEAENREGEVREEARAGIDPLLESAAETIRHQLADLKGGSRVLTILGPEGLRVVIPSDLVFNPGSVSIAESAKPILMMVAEMARGPLPDHPIRIEGHTDDQPLYDLPFADNWGLSGARADSVRKFLEASGGLEGKRMQVVARSMYEPLADNGTSAGRAKNRRVEIVFPAFSD